MSKIQTILLTPLPAAAAWSSGSWQKLVAATQVRVQKMNNRKKTRRKRTETKRKMETNEETIRHHL